MLNQLFSPYNLHQKIKSITAQNVKKPDEDSPGFYDNNRLKEIVRVYMLLYLGVFGNRK